MSEITVDDFDIKFQEIAYSLQKANFIAIDTEFSGLHLDTHLPSVRDKADQRYKKLRQSVQNFNILQVGLATFRYSNEQRVFVAESFNFYLFPSSSSVQTELTATFQVSCVEFLCKHDFDFNKLCYKGIPYLNNRQEKQLQSKFKSHVYFAGIDRDIDERFLQKLCSEVADWVLRAKVGEKHQLSLIKDLPDYVVQREIRDRFGDVWTHLSSDGRVIVEKVSPGKRVELEESNTDMQKNLDKMLGFTRLFRVLVELKKPLIVHNGIMDLLFFYEKFYEPLPESLYEFKRNINQLFPLIYDTKHISLECRRNFKEFKELYDSTVLEPLHTSLTKEIAKKYQLFLPSVKLATNSSAYTIRAYVHEAGYDAFLCGSVFLKLAHALASNDARKCYNLKPCNMNDYFQIMKPYANKVNVIKAALPYINLKGADPPSARINTLFVQSRQNISVYDLTKAFSSFGHTEVTLCSKRTAMVALDSTVREEEILSRLNQTNKYRVSVYNFWKHSPHLNTIIGCSLVTGGAVIFLAYKLAH